MNRFKKACILILALLLQTVFITKISWFGVTPGLLFLVFIFVCSFSDIKESIAFGLLTGILLDLISYHQLGINALLFLYLGMGCSFISGRIRRKNAWFALWFSVLSTFLYEFLFELNLLSQHPVTTVGYGMVHIVLWMCLIHLILSVPLFYITKRLLRDKKPKGGAA